MRADLHLGIEVNLLAFSSNNRNDVQSTLVKFDGW